MKNCPPHCLGNEEFTLSAIELKHIVYQSRKFHLDRKRQQSTTYLISKVYDIHTA